MAETPLSFGSSECNWVTVNFSAASLDFVEILKDIGANTGKLQLQN